MMRKPSSSEGGFRKDRKGHCQHISQKSQSVSQIEKTVPHPPTLLATVPLFVSADVFVKETDASEVFRRAQTNFWLVVLREKVKSFRQSTYPHYLSPTSSVNGGSGARRGNGIPFTCHQVTQPALESRRRPTTLPAAPGVYCRQATSSSRTA